MTDDTSWPLLCKLVERLRSVDSWTGESHVQKAAFVLERLAGLSWPMGFIIYKYGPFSFRLRDQLGEMRAWGYLDLDYELGGYGPRHRLTEKGKALAAEARLDQTMLGLVVQEVGSMGVKDLEKIATGLFLLTEGANQGATQSQLEQQLRSCKPHLTEAEVHAAVEDARNLLSKGRSGKRSICHPAPPDK